MDQWATYPDYDYEEAGDEEDPEYADYYEEYVSNIKIFYDLHCCNSDIANSKILSF